MNSSNNKRIISCPRCKQPAVYSSENAFRPFCSERCKMIDLGEWASESYRVPDKNISNPAENEDSDEQIINSDDDQEAGNDDLH